MTKEQKFRVIHNLDGLSEADVQAYAREAAIYFDLDPDTNPFDICWMNDDGTGMRRRQLYARRGTTDILRDKRGISVTEMAQHDGPGYVSFTAKGVNKQGRQEIAVGAHSTAGLAGERLAAAVSTAETRAGRRLTLKFVGMGILDHTEVTDPVDVKIPAPDLALAGSPVVIPPIPIVSPSIAPSPAVSGVVQDLAEAAEVARQAAEKLKTPEYVPETQEQFNARMNKLRADAQASLNKPETGRVNEPVATKHSVAQNPPIQGVSLQEISASEAEAKNGHSLGSEPAGYGIPNPPSLAPATEAPKPRTRRKKNTVDIASPGQDVNGVPVTYANATPTETKVKDAEVSKQLGYAPKTEMILAPLPAGIPDTPENRARLAAWLKESAPKQADPVVPTQANPAVPSQVNSAAPILANPAPPPPVPALQPHQPILAPPITSAAPTDFPGKPSKEQEEKYRTTFRDYSNNVLPTEGGMTPSPGIGGPSVKMRLFFEHYIGKPTQSATVEEWDEFVTFLAAFKERNGAKGLVKYINDSIGAK